MSCDEMPFISNSCNVRYNNEAEIEQILSHKELFSKEGGELLETLTKTLPNIVLYSMNSELDDILGRIFDMELRFGIHDLEGRIFIKNQ